MVDEKIHINFSFIFLPNQLIRANFGYYVMTL
jgi:hypothetical protein